MKKTAFSLIAAASALALAACGGSDSASEDAVADTVEMPADEAMEDTPEPVAVDDAAADAAEPAEDAAQSFEATGAAAEEAAADAAAAAEAATQAAEEGM